MLPNYRDQGTQTESDTTLQSNGSAPSTTRCIEPPKELPFAEYNLPIELVDEILLAVPMKDLLLAQRVSKSWKGFINWSIPCQRKLFFLPGLPPPPHARGQEHLRSQCDDELWPCCSGDLVEVNPLVMSTDDKFVPQYYVEMLPKALNLPPESSCLRMRVISSPVRWINLDIRNSCEYCVDGETASVLGTCLYGDLIHHLRSSLPDELHCLIHHYALTREPRNYLLRYRIDWMECCDDGEPERATTEWLNHYW